jgi:ribosomal protein S6
MAKQYYQGEYGFKTILKRYPTFKSFVNVLKKDKSNLYLETNDGVMNNIPLVKTIADPKEYNRVLELLTKVKSAKFNERTRDNVVDVTIGNLTWRYYRSGGRLQNVFDEQGNAKAASKPKTEQQEDGVRYLLESGKLQSKQNINKAIGFNFGEDWHNSFERTFNGISDNIMRPTIMKQYNFYRDSNPRKPKFLNQLTDARILPDSKDNWNPSDIWAVKRSSENKLTSEVNKLFNTVLKTKDIEKLNDFIFKKFQSKEIIGISLKQVTAPKATVKKIQTDAKFMDSIRFDGILKKFEFNASNSYFDILFKMKVFKETVEYRFRFRPRGASGQIKTFGEGQPIEQKTFDGAVSSDVVVSEFTDVRAFENNVLKLKTKGNVLSTLKTSNLNKDFLDFVIKDKFKFVEVSELQDKLSDYEIKRAVVLLYYIYNFETASNKQRVFKRFYLAAKKMNEFSSIHYKVF